MEQGTASLDETLVLAMRLSPIDKVRLLERIASTLEQEMSEHLPTTSTPNEEIPATWTDEEVRGMLAMKRLTPTEVVAWLEANPPTEAWGDLQEDDDPAEYIHQMRRRTWSTDDDALNGDDQ